MALRVPETAHDAGVSTAKIQEASGAGCALDLTGQVAELLFSNGQTTSALEEAVARVSHALLWPSRLSARWGELVLQETPRSSGIRIGADPLNVDIGRVLAVQAVVDGLCEGGLSRDDAARTLASVAARPPVSLVRFATMAAAGAAALSIIFGAADVMTVALVAISAALGALFRRGIAAFSHNPFAQSFGAALLAGWVGGCALVFRWPVAHQLVAVCPCMVLVPGPHVLNGMIDLARARIPLGSARILFGSLVALAISTGLLAGLALTGATLPAGASAAPVPLLYDVVAAGVAVAAYGSFFNMPWRLLPVPIAVGMAAHALRWQLLHHGFGVAPGAFAACLLVGTVVAPLAAWLRLPFGASAFAAVVSLMPGLFIFEFAAEGSQLLQQGAAVASGTLVGMGRNAVLVFVILLAMTAGLIIPKMILDLRTKPGAA